MPKRNQLAFGDDNHHSPLMRLERLLVRMRASASVDDAEMVAAKMATFIDELSDQISRLRDPSSSGLKSVERLECPSCGGTVSLGFWGEGRAVECLSCGLRSVADHRPHRAITNWHRLTFIRMGRIDD